MYIPTTFVVTAAAAAVPFLMGSAALAAPLAQQPTSEQQQQQQQQGVLEGIVGSAIFGVAAWQAGRDKLKALEGAHAEEIKSLEADKRQYFKHWQGERTKMDERSAEIKHLLSAKEFDGHKARMGEMKTGWVAVSKWNDAANECDGENHYPDLRVGPGVGVFRVPDKLWLPEEKKWSASSSSSQFALHPSHKEGLLRSVVHQAQRSLKPLTNPAFAASLMKKAESVKETVGKVERAEAF
ncbi:MAG: hypothetical protein M1826_006208 [Phylliscum demangeonii]|nr:MAG: hypothetical protein M1826_006208 [Phylliscum demangeonii]